jgi:ceramide glucosyltransferase
LWLVTAIAVAGTFSCTIFLILTLLGAAKFHRQARAQQSFANQLPELPAVSLLKPVHGLEPQLKENVESFFQQRYPRYEVLFAADTEDDGALPVIREVCARYPHIPSRILINGRPPWPNPPAFSFHSMAEVAAYDILVTSDSDVHVDPDYLREVVPPLLDPEVGMVTCVYRGVNAGGFWSALDAIGMSVEMTAGVVVANLLEGMRFGLGPTIVVRKDALEKIGGYRALGEYFSNDFVIGNLISKAGYRVALSRHIIDHVVPPMTFQRMWDRQVRWARGTRWSRPKGHLGTGFTFAMPYGILGFVAAAAMGKVWIGGALLGAAVLNRVIEAWVIGWGVVRDPVARKSPWLNPVRDLLGFLVWCTSYLGKRSVWRESRYELVEGGKIVLRQTASAGANGEK